MPCSLEEEHAASIFYPEANQLHSHRRESLKYYRYSN
jgi:hypothetical protein